MLLLRRPKHNVVVQYCRHYSSVQPTNHDDHGIITSIASHDDAQSTPPDSQPPIKAANQVNRAFISYNGAAESKPPNRQALIDALGEAEFTKYMDVSPKTRYSLAVKDNICTLDFPTTCASHALEGYQSPFEATVVSLLKKRGARIIGKTNMDEFGMGSHSTHSRFGAVVQSHTRPDGQVVLSLIHI